MVAEGPKLVGEKLGFQDGWKENITDGSEVGPALAPKLGANEGKWEGATGDAKLGIQDGK